MKPTLFLNLMLSYMLFNTSFTCAQNDDGKRVEFQFNERIAFYKVDKQYNINRDTVFHASDGFRVYSGYDIIKDDDSKDYIIFRYGNWKKRQRILSGKPNDTDYLSQVHNMLKLKKNKNWLDSIGIKAKYGIDFEAQHELQIDNNIKEELEKIEESIKKKANEKSIHVEIVGRNGLKLAMPKEDFDKLTADDKIVDVYSLKWKYSTKLASGFMTIPFKLRPKMDSVNFNMTTDITLGAYIGVKKRISRNLNNFIVIPFTLGLSYINVGNSQTSNVNTENNTSVVPGWTWSSGIIIDLNGFNLGFVFGTDYASGVGQDWLYNKKPWISFSFGYSFFSKDSK
jgi:hypothetical protein